MMLKTMRSVVSCAMGVAVAAMLVCPARADFVTVNTFPDIILWSGSGANEAGFVLQFGGSQAPTSIAWGYRWDGSATVEDMMFAIAGSTTISGGGPVPPGLDSRLSLDGAQFDFGGGPVIFLSGITYDQVGLPSPWSQVSREIVDDYSNTGTYPALYSTAGAGGIWTGATMDFAAAVVGISELALTAGGWYGFVQSDGSDPFAFQKPVSAVPEPATLILLAAGVVAAGALWRPRATR